MKNENTPRLETERLVLRKFDEDDLEDMLAIYSDKEVNRFLPWFSMKTIEDVKKYLQNNVFLDYAKASAYRYAVVYKPTNKVIGYVTLCIADEASGGDLGYGLLKEFWGQGITAEACSAVLARLKANGFKLVTATHDVNNPASGAVMKKLGMTYRYSYDELWQPKNFKVTFKLYQIDL